MSFSLKTRSTKLLYKAFIAMLLALITSQPVSAAVTLVYFRAAGSPTQISLEWETASEIDMVGFYILKSETLSGDYEPISSLIHSLGDSFGGATYLHVDSSINQGQTYYYKLQVLDRNQNSEYFGPITGYAGNETLTPTPTNTLTAISATSTITVTGTIAPTLTKTSPSPTRTRTPVPLPTTKPQVLASTRTATIIIAPSAQILNIITNSPEPNNVGIPTATNSYQKIILPSKTMPATDNVPQQSAPQNKDVIGWLLVGIGGSGLFIGAGWLVWAIIRQKSSK